MTNIEVYKTWAPNNAEWTQWAKPVMFANMTSPARTDEQFSINIPEIKWLDFYSQNTAIIVDLPSEKSVEETLALAQIGYRPVPLYNGVCKTNIINMIVNTICLSKALYEGAKLLPAMNIKNDAPPVFMLDSGRMKNWYKTPGMYDNRWCVFPQDMPSASFLLKQKINKIIVRTEKTPSYFNKVFYEDNILNDLTHILFRYQTAGIKIHLSCGNDTVNEFIVSKPSKYKNLFYRFSVLLGLSRNAAGGFGSIVPDLSSESGGYYGAG